jgi:MFS superfamily sulfate permease-like transporter
MTADFWQGVVVGVTISAGLLAVAVAILERAMRNMGEGLASVAARKDGA